MCDALQDALQKKIKFQAFGKTKPPTVKAVKRRLEVTKQSASRLDEEEAEKLLRHQSQIIEDEINQIKAGKQGRATNVFKMGVGFRIEETTTGSRRCQRLYRQNSYV